MAERIASIEMIGQPVPQHLFDALEREQKKPDHPPHLTIIKPNSPVA